MNIISMKYTCSRTHLHFLLCFWLFYKYLYYFKSINKVHQHATRLAFTKSYYLAKVRTNEGKFNIRFNGAKLWNAVKEDLTLSLHLKSASRFRFKKLLKESVISKY